MEIGNKDIHYKLIEAARFYDSAAQFELYNLYSKTMLNVSYRIVKDVSEAEDVLQESFVTAFNKLDSFRGDSTFGSWLKRIVINASINVLKKRKIDYQLIDENRDDRADEIDIEASDLSVDHIKKAIMELPEGFRLVFSLYAMEGYDHKEISEILNVSESTSKSQYNRAKRKLQMILKNMYNYER